MINVKAGTNLKRTLMKLNEHVKDYDLEKTFNSVGIMTYLQHLAPRVFEGCNMTTPPSEQGLMSLQKSHNNIGNSNFQFKSSPLDGDFEKVS